MCPVRVFSRIFSLVMNQDAMLECMRIRGVLYMSKGYFVFDLSLVLILHSLSHQGEGTGSIDSCSAWVLKRL